MKKIKKLLSILLLLATTAGICCLCNACSGFGESDVHVFYYTYSDPYVSSVRQALDSSFEKSGIGYQDYDAAGNQTTQTEQIRTAITGGAKVIAVNLVNTGSDDAAMGIVKMAKDADIPVIFFNREVSDSVVKSYDKCAFVGTDATEAGILQGQMIGEYVKQNYEKLDLNGDGKISYILFKGEEGNNEAMYRTKYAVEEADKILTAAGKQKLSFYDERNPNKYLVDRNGQWSAAAANEYMTTALASHSESRGNMIELVICNNDNMAEGAISALNGAGYNKTGGKTIPVFGVDATAAAIELIKSGRMAGTVKQDASAMAEAVKKLCENGLSGKDLREGLDGYQIDRDVLKLRIAYSKYQGQE